MAAKRQFPQALESEEVVISGLLFYPPALFRVLDHLTDPEDFFSAPLGAIFAALLQLDQTGSVIDLVTVGQQMRQAGTLCKLKAYGDESYLLDLSTRAVTVENIGHHAQQVRQAAEARRLEATQQPTAQRRRAAAREMHAEIVGLNDQRDRAVDEQRDAEPDHGEHRRLHPEAARRQRGERRAIEGPAVRHHGMDVRIGLLVAVGIVLEQGHHQVACLCACVAQLSLNSLLPQTA